MLHDKENHLGKLKYVLRGEIRFPESKLAETIYKSIYNDIVREKLVDVNVSLWLKGSKIEFEVSSDSFAKFRGFTNTLLRLIRIGLELIEIVKQIECKENPS